MRTVQAAIQFTPISLEDMIKYVTRAWHALHPKKRVEKGEVVFDLYLSDSAGIRIWTSIGQTGDTSAGKGDDAIRVQLYHYGKNRPMKPGKAPIVKRTQNWRDSLTDRIEKEMEDYFEHEESILSGEFIRW